MKNKKKVLTVLFAAILAFIAVFFIFRFEHKKTEQVTPEQKIEEQNEILDTTEVKNEDNKQVIEQNVKESIKVQENKTNVKQAIKPTTKKGTVKVPVLKPTEENESCVQPLWYGTVKFPFMSDIAPTPFPS